MSRKKPQVETVPRGMDALGRPNDGLTETADRTDANDSKAFDQAKTEEAARKRADDLVLQNIMDTPSGRDWMYRKLEACHIYDVGADLGSANRNADPYLTYFMAGERNIGNQMLIDLQRASPSQYLTMISEQNEKKALRDA